MDILDEAKEIMEKAGCEKAFAVYELELCDIAEVKNCSKNAESIEIEKKINNLTSTIKRELVLNIEEPIECPLDSSLSKYLEFSLKNKSIAPYNINNEEYKKIEEKINPLLKKYNWSIKTR
ncbi:MAG: hypothetical protein JSW62_00660 [Thermoplasmatales archaeon]|nr:MAG: hypothetical protein JSW62_00660 [Thermoplasmatales archaeon]